MHLRALAFCLTALVTAAAWVIGWSYVGALRVQAGDNVLVVFAPHIHASEVVSALGRAPVRQFEPLGMANAWLVQASGYGLVRALEGQGAFIALQAKGPIHFALGCTTNEPLTPRSSRVSQVQL